MKFSLSLSTLFIACIATAPIHADHGPGTSGSGFTTITAETLKQGAFGSTLQFDYTQFSDAGKIIPDVELIDRSYLTTVSLSYGLTDNFQLGLNYGYYDGQGNRALDAGVLDTFKPDGFTDLWVTGKYRVYQGPLGQFSLLGGVKAPTGDSYAVSTLGAVVEPSATAGTGAWDGMFGAAYTLPLSATLTLDASARYTIRGERYDYRLGNRVDVGTCIGWLVWGDARSFPQISLVGEATLRHVARSVAAGITNGNTGSTVIFLSPGVKVAFNRSISASVGVQLPVIQHLNGHQVDTQFRLISAVNIAF